MFSGFDSTRAAEVAPKRRPYVGGCHCGHIRYVCWLTLPIDEIPYPKKQEGLKPCQMIRKCNCRICHKSGMFHIRLADSPKDFVLLSPLDPAKELTRYSPRAKRATGSWPFCPTCGVRAFMIDNVENGEVVERDLAAEGVDLKLAGIEGDGTKVKVWKLKEDGWTEERTGAFRINATSLEGKQEGLDLREFVERGWVEFYEHLDNSRESQYGKPFDGGCY